MHRIWLTNIVLLLHIHLSSDTRESAAGALNASQAYEDIVKAINEALNASDEALDAAEDATDLSLGLAEEAAESKERSHNLKVRSFFLYPLNAIAFSYHKNLVHIYNIVIERG